jgi:uncharacterized glyoxalase superfamily protein PhnB
MTTPTKLFPLFVTPDLAALERFYVEGLRWTLTHRTPGYLQVRDGDTQGPELCFMVPDGAMPFPTFEGKGVIVSVPVADADAHCATIRERGLTPLGEPSDKPWGWRSYLVRDPAGVMLDFFHELAATAAKTG